MQGLQGIPDEGISQEMEAQVKAVIFTPVHTRPNLALRSARVPKITFKSMWQAGPMRQSTFFFFPQEH